MRKKEIASALLGFLLHISHAAILRGQDSPPPAIPVEFFAGTRYATTNVILTRDLWSGSQFGFFQLSTATYTYEGDDELSLQNMLYFEPVSSYRLTGGLIYGSGSGISPTVGAQYVRAGAGRFLLLSPRVNIQERPSYSLFTIGRYGVGNPPGLGPYFSVQALTSFGADGHIKSYQWLRVGLESAGNQFGLGVNFDEAGPRPGLEVSAGLFVRREIN